MHHIINLSTSIKIPTSLNCKYTPKEGGFNVFLLFRQVNFIKTLLYLLIESRTDLGGTGSDPGLPLQITRKKKKFEVKKWKRGFVPGLNYGKWWQSLSSLLTILIESWSPIELKDVWNIEQIM
jgi:hypothetical protein